MSSLLDRNHLSNFLHIHRLRDLIHKNCASVPFPVLYRTFCGGGDVLSCPVQEEPEPHVAIEHLKCSQHD